MNKNFDIDQAKKFLQNRESLEKEQRERERVAILALVENTLKSLFRNNNIEIYLVGSITQPYMFYLHSDIDIVIKNYKGDRFDLWTKLETLIKRKVEVILFENCHFQEHVIKNGCKVL